jgi:hypothetical protein
MTEALGQRVLILKTVSGFEGFSTKFFDSKALTQIGFTDFSEYDENFYWAVSPPGWTTKQDGGNPYLLWFKDNLSRKRASQVDKSSIGDYKRSLFVSTRFLSLVVKNADKGSYHNYHVGEDYVGIVVDQGTSEGKPSIIWQTQPLKLSEEKPLVEAKELRRLAEKWLQSNYPEHKNPFAYWD